MSTDNRELLEISFPFTDYPQITMAHGGGGRLTHQLIQNLFKPAFDNADFESDHDGALLNIAGVKLAFTTDSFIVNPIFFPGGDIGRLAVFGTVNDLAMCGARPLYVSLALVLEEGFSTRSLEQIVLSLRQAAEEAGIRLVTGDTKVVDRGRGHGLYITTAGIGQVLCDQVINPSAVKPGDTIIVSGDIGRHGIAVMSQREGLAFETGLLSDCAPLSKVVQKLIETGVEIHCLRDLTRGGLATALVEIAQSSGLDIQINESSIPIHKSVRSACEILGIDPIYVACEGRFLAIVPVSEAEPTMEILSSFSYEFNPAVIGQVTNSRSGLVSKRGLLGVEHIVDMLSGDQFPRIC